VKTMAEVLTEHTRLVGAVSGFESCRCGKWDRENVHSEHQAAMLTAAGFGPVKAAAAGAWDEGFRKGAAFVETAAAVDEPGEWDNPYRAATIEADQ
jgi:hypothetical protein